MLNTNLDSGWIGRKGEAVCQKEMAIRKLRKAADRLIPNSLDRFPGRVSVAFGFGCDSRIEAGIICQNLANQLQEELDNGR